MTAVRTFVEEMMLDADTRNTPAEIRAATLAVCFGARNIADAAQLLDALGLLEGRE